MFSSGNLTFLSKAKPKASGLNHKNITIVNENSKVFRMALQVVASHYNHHSDDSRGVTYTPREHL
jgi:hypothetical protein